ncbi:hypothetical protein FSP39_002172 [Pinctada imbricata]|uniref:WAPL domain-containing protein n=1 Tax=Pinctada imbricata TaxID=66713 RepID=A0AA89C9N7_PINIB|nr:hypothetical protein FSP39_002172 [Pinctada imbricata]
MASKVRTYSRAANKDQPQPRVEDAKAASAINPIKAEKSKWGDTSFVRVREDDPFEVTYKKVKVENETVDPFTFDLEEDGTVIRAAPVNNAPSPSVPTRGLGRPAIPTVKIGQKDDSPVMPETSIDDTEIIDADLDEEPTMLKKPVRTYSRGAKKDAEGIGEITEEVEDTIPVEEEQDPFADKTDIFEDAEAKKSVFDDDDDDDMAEMTVKRPNTRQRGAQRTYSRREKRGEAAKITSKTHILQSEEDDGTGGPTVLNFRSQYMDPAVYSTFKYTPQEEDPVGRMNNSKVLQSSEIKHGKGSTLIVICSPKPPAEGKQTLHPVKTYKVKGSKIQLVAEEDGTAQPQMPTGRGKREAKKREPVVRPKRARRGRVEEVVMVEQQAEENTEMLEEPGPPVLEPNISHPVPISLHEHKPLRVNKIFRSRNKGVDSDAKEASQATDIVQAAAIDSQIDTEQVAALYAESSTPEDDLDEVLAPPSGEEMFGFGEDKAEEPAQLEDQSAFTTSQIQDEPHPEGSSQDTESMDVDNQQEEDLDDDSQPPKLSQSGSLKSKRVTMLREEADAESLSSEGEFDSSQEITSDSQNSTGETRAGSKDRKFFKSKSKDSGSAPRKIFQSPKKSPSKAKYNVRSWQDDIDEEDRNKKNGEGSAVAESGPPKLVPEMTTASKVTKPPAPIMEPPKLTRAVHWPDKLGDEAFTSVHVTKEHKQLYTVVRNVKEAHECQEYGETQDFSDDVDYLLVGLKEGEPMSTRCLSCIGLAQKSILPAFRMHLRAHGTVAKIFGHLQDSITDPSLALCTALLMFMMSRDKLNMDLDRQSLDLMLKLLGVDVQEEMSITMLGKRVLNRNKDRVREVYEQWRMESGSNTSEIEDVSTGNLAMESLLSLTSRRAGEWFKEELRTLGALDHIVDTVCTCIEAIDDNTTLLTDSAIENLKKTDRCLRVLENVSFVNTDNQTYLISYKTGALLVSLCRALATCEKFLPVYPIQESVDKDSTGYVVYSCVLAVLRVLLNITHENEFGCTKVGDQLGFISTVLTCILQTPKFVPLDFRFDLLVLSLGLLINMVEHCSVNRRKLMDANALPSYDLPELQEEIPATKALVQVFCKRFEVAKKMEEQDFSDATTTPQQSPNKSGEWRESDSGIEWVVASGSKKTPGEVEEDMDQSIRLRPPQGEDKNNDADDEETFAKALHRAGKHMENSIIASYVALLLGCLIQDNTVFVSRLKEHLPNQSFDDLITILKKFLGFISLTTAVGSSGGKSIAHVIEVLEGC